MNTRIANNLEFNKSFFDYLQSNPYLPVFWIDSEGYIFNVNDAVCNYLGYTKDELIRMHICQIDTSTSEAQVDDLISFVKEYKINRFESKHRKKNGDIIDVEIISNYYYVEGLEFSFNYVFDISEKKQKERELVKSNEEYAELTDRLENIVYEKTKALSDKINELEQSEKTARINEDLMLNAFRTSQDAINLNSIEDGTYIQVNTGFTKIMGYTQEEVIGKSSLDLNIWRNPDDRFKLVKELKEKGYCHNLEADFISKDGRIIHGLMSASIQEYKGKNVILNVSKDITQIKKLENELKKLNSQLQTRVEREVEVIRKQQEIIFEQKKLADMGMMINAIAHQWRQPLNVIGLRTQEIADWYRGDMLTDDYVEQFEEQQMKTVEYLSTTIEDFRTFFKPDGKETEFDAGTEIISLLRLVEVQMLAKGIKAYISYFCEPDAVDRCSLCDFPDDKHSKTIVKGFSGEFKQVMTNLIYNAIFAIEERAKKDASLKGFIHVIIHALNGRVIINVEDNGGGIPNKIKPNVFNPYFTTKEDGKGTGLGLYLAKLIIETHMNGTISVSNTKDGADFEIILPAAGS